jgi:LytS/YehU family sensor histidine kinase
VSLFSYKRKQQHKIEAFNRQKIENELQLNTLRSKVLPHFTKNVLSAIGHFAMTDKLKAGHYISVFSKFNGMTLANADKNYILLSEELDYIIQYLELEKMRFGDRFDYKLQMGSEVSPQILIPTMLLHTYCDNAIRHGLVNKEGTGLLIIEIQRKENGVLICVTDNGIGRMRAAELGTHGNRQGLKLIELQVEFYNRFNKQKMLQQIIDLVDSNGNAQGTKSTLFIPDGFTFKYG